MLITEQEMKDIIEAKSAPVLKSEREIANMETLVENQIKYINEESVSGDVAAFTNILVPAMRRIMPALFAKELVSVQPMSGPTGHIYAQRWVYKGSKDDSVLENDIVAIGADIVITPVQNIIYSEKDDAGKIVKAILRDYAAVDGDGVTATYSTQAAFKQVLQNYTGPHTTAEGEVLGSAMNQVGFKIDRVTVTAVTRKLKSEYTLEFVQDLQSQHGQNAETELLNLIQYELAAEIDQEILGMVKNSAVVMTDVTLNGDKSIAEGEVYAPIYTRILQACEDIVTTTRRGAGNIVVASPKVIAALSLTGKVKTSGTNLNNTVDVAQSPSVTFVGTLDNGARVFRDSFSINDEVLVAYKGASAADAGAFYSPYIPLQVQRATNPETLQPIIACSTRYGITENPLSEGEGNQYFRSFKVLFTGTTLA